MRAVEDFWWQLMSRKQPGAFRGQKRTKMENRRPWKIVSEHRTKVQQGIGVNALNTIIMNREWRHCQQDKSGEGDRKVATKVAKDPQLSPTFLTNHLCSLSSPKAPQDYSQPSILQNSAFNHQHHYMIGIFGISSDLHHTSVIGYRCYQSSDFDIGDYSSLFYFYPLTPTHVIPYYSFLSPHSHTHLMTPQHYW